MNLFNSFGLNLNVQKIVISNEYKTETELSLFICSSYLFPSTRYNYRNLYKLVCIFCDLITYIFRSYDILIIGR